MSKKAIQLNNCYNVNITDSEFEEISLTNVSMSFTLDNVKSSKTISLNDFNCKIKLIDSWSNGYSVNENTSPSRLELINNSTTSFTENYKNFIDLCLNSPIDINKTTYIDLTCKSPFDNNYKFWVDDVLDFFISSIASDNTVQYRYNNKYEVHLENYILNSIEKIDKYKEGVVLTILNEKLYDINSNIDKYEDEFEIIIYFYDKNYRIYYNGKEFSLEETL